MAKLEDSFVASWFGVEFQGAVSGAFQECSGLGSENEVVVQKSSTDGKFIIKKIAGNLKWNDITLKRGITTSMDLWTWRGMVEKGDLASARKNGTITMFSHEGSPIAKWDFVNAWPSKLTGPTPTAQSDAIAIEEMVIVHEGYQRSQ